MRSPKNQLQGNLVTFDLFSEIVINATKFEKTRIHFKSDVFAAVAVVDVANLSKDVFERRTSTGSEAFSLLICLDANKFVLLSFFSLIKTIYPRVSTEPLPNDAKSPLPVDVRLSKTLLLKLPLRNVLTVPSCSAGGIIMCEVILRSDQRCNISKRENERTHSLFLSVTTNYGA